MIENLVVVSRLADWPHELAGTRVVSSQEYLTDARWGAETRLRVFNLCRSYAYQSAGYYVSLLAEARGHRPQPDVLTIQDMKGPNPLRLEQLDELVQRTLRRIPHAEFELSIYFGRTLAERDRQLGRRIFGLFPAPLIRAFFQRRHDRWRLKAVRPIPAGEVPETHRPEMIRSAELYFRSRRELAPGPAEPRWSLAILVDPDEEEPPSDDRAIQKFSRAFQRRGFSVELVTSEDSGRIKEFDALFVRATTAVHHFTFRFSRRAAREGLVVIDSPEAIVRCANKVFLAELLARHGLPTPKTVLVHRDSVDEVIPRIGLPSVLKLPDSAYSMGVVKVTTREELEERAHAMLEKSALIVAQEFARSDFDWRIGVLDGRALYACKYHMAEGHWQIIHRVGRRTDYGRVEAMPVEEAPRSVVRLAVRAARLIGDGLYGVDVKVVGRRPMVIEVNDNPSLEAGYEDRALGDALYDAVAEAFERRLVQRERAASRRRPKAGA
ncbi:MAG TPA: RimK family protein [Thermoanaerobaculia bacterium]|nr:RimK family protein [Thermoanaerobaculia bacterium]